MGSLPGRSVLGVLFLAVLLVGGAGCERKPKPEVDRAQALETLRTRVSPAEWEGCPADVIPERASELELFRLTHHCDKRLAWCAGQCFASDAAACYGLSEAMLRDARDTALAEPLLYRSCALGVMASCTQRAFELKKSPPREGDSHSVTVVYRDYEKVTECAARTVEKTCALGDASGCALHARNLALGTHVKRDWKKAREAAERACTFKSGIVACESARNLLSSLDEVEQAQRPQRSAK